MEKPLPTKKIFIRSNLFKRILTGILAGGATIYVIYVHSIGFLMFTSIVSLATLFEFFMLVNVHKSRFVAFVAVLIAIGGWIVVGFSYHRDIEMMRLLSWLLLSVPILSVTILYRKREKTGLILLAYLIFGYIYTVLPFYLFFALSFEKEFIQGWQYNFRIALAIIFLHWLADTSAYFIGRFLGKRTLFRRISPKKTWEGFLGAVVLTLLLGWYFQITWPVKNINWVTLALIISVVGMYGDLVESMLKRNLNVKDSSGLLPGHGGFLDRFDGFLLTLPCIYIYIFFLPEFNVYSLFNKI